MAARQQRRIVSGDKALANFKKGIIRTATGFAYLRNSSLLELIIGSSAQNQDKYSNPGKAR
jgi:hypothetical protein